MDDGDTDGQRREKLSQQITESDGIRMTNAIDIDKHGWAIDI